MASARKKETSVSRHIILSNWIPHLMSHYRSPVRANGLPSILPGHRRAHAIQERLWTDVEDMIDNAPQKDLISSTGAPQPLLMLPTITSSRHPWHHGISMPSCETATASSRQSCSGQPALQNGPAKAHLH